jgi:rubredoxin
MKKWRCTVCGYIHEGDQPPDQCPVCGADKSLFEEISASGERKTPSALQSEAQQTIQRWKCSVCGFIVEGEAPPDICPVCGASGSLYEKTSSQPSGSATEKTTAPASVEPAPEKTSQEISRVQKIMNLIVPQVLKHHIHPVSVHIPNGVLPVSVVFILIAALTGCKALSTAALCNMIFIVLSMPLVIFTGYIEWKNRYRGFLTSRFVTKMVCAAVVASGSFAVACWGMLDPNVIIQDSPAKWGFVLVNLGILGAAGLAGFIGGKLVFKD